MILPDANWSRERALDWLFHRLQDHLGVGTLLPVYIADEAHGEATFRALKALERGVGAVTIVVGPLTSEASSLADYRLRDMAELGAFLHGLARALRGDSK